MVGVAMANRFAIAALQATGYATSRIAEWTLFQHVTQKVVHSSLSRSGNGVQRRFHETAHGGCTTVSRHLAELKAFRSSTAQQAGCASSRRYMSSLGVVSPAPRKLNDIVVLESLQSLDSEDIATVWKTFYQDRPAEVPIVLLEDQWQTMHLRMVSSKTAVVPVYKAPLSGLERRFLSMLCQAQMPKYILITPLASFQQHGTEANPTIIVTFYDEIIQTKQIVLGRADILDGAVVSKAEARKLLEDLVLCYTNDKLYQHICLLNQSSEHFDFDVFMRSLSSEQKL